MARKLMIVTILVFLYGVSVNARLPQLQYPSQGKALEFDGQVVAEYDSTLSRDPGVDRSKRNFPDLSGYGESGKEVIPSVIAEVQPLFFQRASLVMVQLVRDHLSKTFLGSLETYADGMITPP